VRERRAAQREEEERFAHSRQYPLTVTQARLAFAQAQSGLDYEIDEDLSHIDERGGVQSRDSTASVSEFIEGLARVAVSKWRTKLISFKQKLALVIEAVLRIHDELPEVMAERAKEDEVKRLRRIAGARVLVAHDPALMRRGKEQRGRRGSALGGKVLIEEVDGAKADETRQAEGSVWRP